MAVLAHEHTANGPKAPVPMQTLDEIVDKMTSLKPVIRLQKAWKDAGAPGVMPPQYVKREVVKGTLAPIGRYGGPLATRTNASTLHLYGAGLTSFEAWQARSALGCSETLTFPHHCQHAAHVWRWGHLLCGQPGGVSCRVTKKPPTRSQQEQGHHRGAQATPHGNAHQPQRAEHAWHGLATHRTSITVQKQMISESLLDAKQNALLPCQHTMAGVWYDGLGDGQMELPQVSWVCHARQGSAVPVSGGSHQRRALGCVRRGCSVHGGPAGGGRHGCASQGRAPAADRAALTEAPALQRRIAGAVKLSACPHVSLDLPAQCQVAGSCTMQVA